MGFVSGEINIVTDDLPADGPPLALTFEDKELINYAKWTLLIWFREGVTSHEWNMKNVYRLPLHRQPVPVIAEKSGEAHSEIRKSNSSDII